MSSTGHGMKLSIVDGEKKADILLDSMSDPMKHRALEGLFGVFGVTLSNNTPPTVAIREAVEIQFERDVKPAHNVPLHQRSAAQGEVTVVREQPKVAPAPVSQVPPTVRLYNKTDVPTEFDTIHDWLVANQGPKGGYWYDTGIKYKQDKPAFKSRYVCSKCEHKGVHYIWEGTETVDCHHCQTSLIVKKSTPGVIGLARDPFGCFYVAGLQIPVVGIVHSNSKHAHLFKETINA